MLSVGVTDTMLQRKKPSEELSTLLIFQLGMKKSWHPSLLTSALLLYPRVQAKDSSFLWQFPLHCTSYVPHPLHFSQHLPAQNKHGFYRSTFTLCKIYWILWFRASYIKKESQCNNIIFNEVLHFFHPSLGISDIILLGQDTGILPHVHGSVAYLVMVNGNWHHESMKHVCQCHLIVKTLSNLLFGILRDRRKRTLHVQTSAGGLNSWKLLVSWKLTKLTESY